MKPRLIRLSFFIWVIIPVVLFTVWLAIGLPHAIWSYRFLDNGDRYNLDVPRTYTQCTFWGPYGVFTVPAHNGRCGYVRFFKENG